MKKSPNSVAALKGEKATAGAVKNKKTHLNNNTASGRKEVGKMKIKEFKYSDIVMTDKELAEVIEASVANMTQSEVLEMMKNIIDESKKAEPGALEKASPLGITTYILMEMYKYGFMTATYLMNETFKKSFIDEEE